jgi:uncharacterized delta-60 repeat protein
MKHPWIALLLMSLSLATFPAESAPDDLDPSFGTGGQHFFEAFDEYRAYLLNVKLLPLPNGDIAVSDGFPWLRRTSPNAERTETFDLAFACGDIPPGQCPVNTGALAGQLDGKIVIAFSVGPAWGIPTRIGVVRMHADGSPDLLFGTAGAAVVSPASFSFSRFFAIGTSVQSDGGLLVAGSLDRTLVLARFLAAGEPDRTFGAGGILRFDRFMPVAFLQTANGNLVLASDAALMRLLPNGQVDATFDAHDALIGSFFIPRALAEQGDGKLVVAGGFNPTANREAIAVMRLDAQGRRDTSFGTDGMVVLPFEDDRRFESTAVALDSRARIVVSATVWPKPEVGNSIAVARFLPDGAVDTFFAGGGLTTLQTTGQLASAAVVITPSDGILIGGTSWQTAGPMLLRLHGGEGSVSRPVREERAIEFYHAGFGHYFIAATQREIATLDHPSCGIPPCEISRPWQRTGRTFRVWSGNAPHLSAACRFFSGQSFAPKSSHFHTPYVEECASLRAGSIWTFEGEPFRLQLPIATPAGLGCPAGSVSLYRAYNNGIGGAPNHRYTDDPAILASMLDQGWAFEGDIQTKVFACIPAP